MAPWKRRRFERTLPVRHIGIARQVAAEQVRFDRENVEAVRDDGETCGHAAVCHRHLPVRPVDVFGLHRSLSRKILQAPGTFALELDCTFRNLRPPCEEGEFAEIRHAMIITAQVGIMKGPEGGVKSNLQFSRRSWGVAGGGRPREPKPAKYRPAMKTRDTA